MDKIVTPAKVAKLMHALKEHKKKPGPLMPSLQDAQKIFGCVNVEIQKIISKELNISVSKINGVVTFYSQFTLKPSGDNVIAVCLGTACYVKGSQSIIDKFSQALNIGVNETSADNKFTLIATRCIGACGLAPVMTINEEVYGNLNVQQAQDALHKVLEESK